MHTVCACLRVCVCAHEAQVTFYVRRQGETSGALLKCSLPYLLDRGSFIEPGARLGAGKAHICLLQQQIPDANSHTRLFKQALVSEPNLPGLYSKCAYSLSLQSPQTALIALWDLCSPRWERSSLVHLFILLNGMKTVKEFSGEEFL